MEKVMRNEWVADGAVERARILRHDVHPEGVDVERVRFVADGTLPLARAPRLISLIRGEGTVDAADLSLTKGSHLYLPASDGSSLAARAGTELFLVVAPDARQGRADRPIVKQERFLRASGTSEAMLRWVLTPQYLSRRIFLHHDAPILSRAGEPLSWFRTTMFDVSGLPANDAGESVFKMAYNHRTEPNFCYEVVGEARVRMAERPYAEPQRWGPWQTLDAETTYHLNEPAEVGAPRNKHEVFSAGHVSLFCMFDPAPTGAEQHRAGEYSEYGPLSAVLGTDAHRARMAALAPIDEMIEALSMSEARGTPADQVGPHLRARYDEALRAQEAQEAALLDRLARESEGRDAVVRPWAITPR